eukprot:scaffold1884_cov343-Ochromonas_danica.AAC.33
MGFQIGIGQVGKEPTANNYGVAVKLTWPVGWSNGLDSGLGCPTVLSGGGLNLMLCAVIITL